jgi:hypothetical protein
VIAGLLFGVMVPLYPNFLMFGLLGIGLMLVTGWRAAEERRAHLVHAAITVAIAVLMSSWYLGPLIVAYAQGKTQVVADQFKSGALANTQFQLFDNNSALLFTLQLIGAVGIQSAGLELAVPRNWMVCFVFHCTTLNWRDDLQSRGRRATLSRPRVGDGSGLG